MSNSKQHWQKNAFPWKSGFEFLNSLPYKYILAQVCHYLDYKDLWFCDKHLMKFESIYWCHSKQYNGHFICVMFPVFCWYWVTQTWQFGFLCLLMISSHRSSSRKFIWTNIESRDENLTRNCRVQVKNPKSLKSTHHQNTKLISF